MWYKGFTEKKDPVLIYSHKADAEDVNYFCPITLLYAVHDHILHCFIQSYTFAYGFGEVCVSGHLISFPFFAGITTDFQVYTYIICLITDQIVLNIPCKQWKQCVYSNIFPGAVCFYFSSSWKTVRSHQTKNNWKTKSATHQTW